MNWIATEYCDLTTSSLVDAQTYGIFEKKAQFYTKKSTFNNSIEIQTIDIFP